MLNQKQCCKPRFPDNVQNFVLKLQNSTVMSQEIILRIRGTPFDNVKFGDCSFVHRKIARLNVNAIKLSDLIDLNSEVLEPPLTTLLSNKDLKSFKDTPMQVPKWPSHTQSVERCVKMVTEATGHVYSHEQRGGYISCYTRLYKQLAGNCWKETTARRI